MKKKQNIKTGGKKNLNIKKILIGITLIGMFLIPAGANIVSAAAEGPIEVYEDTDAFTVKTEFVYVKIVPDQGQVMWWSGRNNTEEMYKLQLVKIQEFGGNDSLLDSKSEFIGMSYNLVSEDWDYVIDKQDDQLTITLSLLGLANGADVHIIMHVSTIDMPINGTDRIVKALDEVKFDIIVDNWTFGVQAQGYAIQTYLQEMRNPHRVRVRNGTVNEYGPHLRVMEFIKDEADDVLGYYEWTTFANIYNDTDLVDTVDVGTVFFEDLVDVPIEGNGEGLAHVYLTYPKYGDGLKMVHDPIFGVNDYDSLLWLYITLPVGVVILGVVVITLIYRRKQN